MGDVEKGKIHVVSRWIYRLKPSGGKVFWRIQDGETRNNRNVQSHISVPAQGYPIPEAYPNPFMKDLVFERMECRLVHGNKSPFNVTLFPRLIFNSTTLPPWRTRHGSPVLERIVAEAKCPALQTMETS